MRDTRGASKVVRSPTGVNSAGQLALTRLALTQVEFTQLTVSKPFGNNHACRKQLSLSETLG
jgi:hypothetical protein